MRLEEVPIQRGVVVVPALEVSLVFQWEGEQIHQVQEGSSLEVSPEVKKNKPIKQL